MIVPCVPPPANYTTLFNFPWTCRGTIVWLHHAAFWKFWYLRCYVLVCRVPLELSLIYLIFNLLANFYHARMVSVHCVIFIFGMFDYYFSFAYLSWKQNKLFVLNHVMKNLTRFWTFFDRLNWVIKLSTSVWIQVRRISGWKYFLTETLVDINLL